MSVLRKGGGPMGDHEVIRVDSLTKERSISFPASDPKAGEIRLPKAEVVPIAGEDIGRACQRLVNYAPAFMIFNGVRVESTRANTVEMLVEKYHQALGRRDNAFQPSTYKEAVEAKKRAHLPYVAFSTDPPVEAKKERAHLPFAVFSTDPRTVAQAALKFEVTQESGKPFADAVHKLWKLAEEGHAPERDWYKEAHELAERIGRPWHETPQPSIVEALSRAAREDLMPLGFPTTSIAGGANADLYTSPQILVKPRYLIVQLLPQRSPAEDSLAGFLVRDLRVGNRTILTNANPLPASVFAPAAFPFRLDLGAADYRQTITLSLTSMLPYAVTVNAMLMCETPKAVERTGRGEYQVNLNAVYGKRAPNY